jgi:hypothetical protein
MKKTNLVLAMVLGLFMLLTIAAQIVSADCTLGVKDCRHSSPGSTTCYWWVCETCGSETCWIFQGTTCTCPVSKNENGPYDHDQMITKCSGDSTMSSLSADQNRPAERIIIAAADSCTDWMQQSNGCSWRTCVDSQGHQYCEQCCSVVTSSGTYTNSCSRVTCN